MINMGFRKGPVAWNGLMDMEFILNWTWDSFGQNWWNIKLNIKIKY